MTWIIVARIADCLIIGFFVLTAFNTVSKHNRK